jgi:hypothetical protein
MAGSATPPATPAPPDSAQRIAAIERLIARDPARRGIARLVQWGSLERAARALLGARRVGIISGFYLPKAKAGETDGPPGAKAIGQALEALGGTAVYITDVLNAPLFHALGLARVELYREGLLDGLHLTHLVSTERPGRAADGRYYNMAGRDITAVTAPIDELFLQAPARRLPTIAIGDGGNETGMGNVIGRVRSDIPHGETIGCVVGCDHLIVAGVSNWGAWGLVAALSVLTGRVLLPGAALAEQDLRDIVAAGACDGQTFLNEPTVDSQSLAANLAFLEELRGIILAPRTAG